MPKQAGAAQRAHALRKHKLGRPLTCSCKGLHCAMAGQPRRCSCDTIQNLQKDEFGAQAPVITPKIMRGIKRKVAAYGDPNYKPPVKRKGTLRNTEMQHITAKLNERTTTSTASLQNSLRDKSDGRLVSQSTINQAVRRRLNKSRKKVSFYNPRRSHRESALARRSIRAYLPENTLFLDGSHLAKDDFSQRYGRSDVNTKAMAPSLIMSSEEGLETVMCAFSTEGFVMDTFELISGPMTIERYMEWAEDKLAHRMAPCELLEPSTWTRHVAYVADRC
jgi:hypothetical protein